MAAVVLISVSMPLRAADYGGYRPHYQGFAVNTPGGRGGAVYVVSNLTDRGLGSLRAGLEASGPRIVVFEISGTIVLQSDITITQSYLTVAGQTAPSPGITIRNGGIYIRDAHDIVFQHFRMRMGDQGTQGITLWLYDTNASSTLPSLTYNIVLDHLSISWGNASTLVSNMGSSAAVLDCLLAYNLRKVITDTGMASLSAFNYRSEVTYARNLWVHNSNRSPWLGAGTRASVINNVIYGSGNSGGVKETMYGFLQIMVAPYAPYGETNAGWNLELVAQNNRIIGSYNTGSGDTAGTHASTKAIDVWLDTNPASQASRLFLSGNIGPHMTLADQWSGVDFYATGNRAAFDYGTVPAWHAAVGYELVDPTDLVARVVANAGARPLDRDSVDLTAVRHTLAGLAGDTPNMGSRITSQSQMGGWPTLAENRRSLQVPANPHAVAPGQTFRTNIEVWLEAFAAALEPSVATVAPGRPVTPSELSLR